MSTEREQVEALAWASARLAALEAIREGDRVREPNNQSIIDTPYWRGYQSALHDLSQIDPGTLDPTHGLPGVEWLAEIKAAARTQGNLEVYRYMHKLLGDENRDDIEKHIVDFMLVARAQGWDEGWDERDNDCSDPYPPHRHNPYRTGDA